MTGHAALVRSDGGLHVEQGFGQGKCILRVLRAGICGTDLQIFRRVRADAARVLGHEGVAETEDAHFVIFNPVDPADQDRILGHSHDGIFRERTGQVAGTLCAADPMLVADLAPLVEPLATVGYAWRLLELDHSVGSVGIWGGGSSAVLAALVGEIRGVSTHLFCDRSERIAWLHDRRLLSTTAIHLSDESGIALDAAIICVPREGAMRALGAALRCVRADGTIDLFGGFRVGDRHPELPDIDLGLVRRSNVCGAAMTVSSARRPVGGPVRLCGHRGTSTEQLLEAQNLLTAHSDRFGAVVSDVISLEQAATAIPRMARRGPPEFLKVIIDLTMSSPSRSPDLRVTLAEARATS